MKQFLLETLLSIACTIVLMTAVITELLLTGYCFSLVLLPAAGVLIFTRNGKKQRSK